MVGLNSFFPNNVITNPIVIKRAPQSPSYYPRKVQRAFIEATGHPLYDYISTSNMH
jgi:hypothetical protein